MPSQPYLNNTHLSLSERGTEPMLDTSPSPIRAMAAPRAGHETSSASIEASAASDNSKKDNNPVSLDAMLHRPQQAAQNSAATAQPEPAQNKPARALEVLQAQAVRTTSCADLEGELLLVHAGTEEGTVASHWMRQVLDGASLHSARFQDNLGEQVLLLQPQLVLIHFDLPVLELAARLVEQLRSNHPQLAIVAVGRMRNPQSTLAALRAGVKEFLDLDDNSQSVQNTVRGLMARTPTAVADTGKSAPLTALVAARAGTGCSLLASHLALYLQQRLQAHNGAASAPAQEPIEAALDTLLIDLGHPASDCAMYLNCFGEFDFLAAVHNLRRFDRKLAASALAKQAQGLRLLALPKQHSKHEPAPADTDLIVLRLRQYFRHVIADLGAVQPSDLGLRVAVRASQIWVVCEQTVASVVSTTQLLEQLVSHKVDQKRLQLIVNRYDARLELEPEQIAKQLQVPLLAQVPERRIPLTQAINQGALLPTTLHREPYVQELNRLSEHLVKLHQLQPALKAQSGLSRLFNRHPGV